MDQKEITTFTRILIFSLLIFAIIVAFVISFVRQSKKFHKLKLDAEVKASEVERKRIASDLHDDLGPVLASIKIYINSLTVTGLQNESIVEKINMHLELCLQQVRAIANSLMPNTLQRNGLKKGLEEFIYNIEKVAPLKIHLTFPDTNLKLLEEDTINFYRILQEIITNTIKHSKCNNLEIVVKSTENFISLNTKDDGIGFEYNDYSFESEGLGISNIKNRVYLLNGTLELNASKKNGVEYKILFPISKKNK